MYVIQNDVTKEKYISYTSDLKARIVSHNGGGKKATTRTDGVWKYIYIELFRSREDAQERKLKAHGSAKQKLLLRLRKSLL
ncbi:excinuclease ABC subunit C [Candidatus Kaiserbacteria bacterium CG_4_8_14_3_um_filter_38_9]|uniref:Excinuclease ABC subunit C n=1 Tax=Candidatus Kaiserbacteria bacterium CG_4_8_14_3_um_filter_38_9 TaxID=1974599 RepID=A0A2M7IN69_9BACT|nr:MAG: excinuclease ABC subunit C [Candidatus Kaiserbacteria bacterium CG_4_8_14_3_um_filter_38_9]